MLTGAVLLFLAEQAFAHAHMIGFPHQEYARQFLLPASIAAFVLGTACTVWGALTDRQPRPDAATDMPAKQK